MWVPLADVAADVAIDVACGSHCQECRARGGRMRYEAWLTEPIIGCWILGSSFQKGYVSAYQWLIMEYYNYKGAREKGNLGINEIKKVLRVAFDLLRDALSAIFGLSELKATVADLENEFKNFGSIKLGGVQVRAAWSQCNICPGPEEDNVAQKLCYNCGAFEHSLATCPQPLEDGNFLQYAREIVEAFEVIVADKATMEHTIIPSIEAKNRKGHNKEATYCGIAMQLLRVVRDGIAVAFAISQ
ncbi:hypothetical protein Tco_0261459 [Tanacetum coccineum]